MFQPCCTLLLAHLLHTNKCLHSCKCFFAVSTCHFEEGVTQNGQKVERISLSAARTIQCNTNGRGQKQSGTCNISLILSFCCIKVTCLTRVLAAGKSQPWTVWGENYFIPRWHVFLATFYWVIRLMPVWSQWDGHFSSSKGTKCKTGNFRPPNVRHYATWPKWHTPNLEKI